MKNLIIASTSTLHNGSYLDYLLPELKKHFAAAETILFIPIDDFPIFNFWTRNPSGSHAITPIYFIERRHLHFC